MDGSGRTARLVLVADGTVLEQHVAARMLRRAVLAGDRADAW